MLRNSKPKMVKLTKDLANELNDMGFYSNGLFGSGREKIDEDTKLFEKKYNCCGGSFGLLIRLGRPYIFCGDEINPEVQITTPYNSWWCARWNISDFTKEMEDFQNELKKDLQKLRKLGVIS